MAEAKTNGSQQELQTRTATAEVVASAPAAAEVAAAEISVVTDKRILVMRKKLDALSGWIQQALPKHIPASRFIRVVLISVQRQPKLLECDPTSFFGALMQCAALGLEPDGLLGQAHLVPFGKQVQFIPGYRGLIKLVRQSGEVAGLYARPVRGKDEFKYEFGLDEKLVHVPHRGDKAGDLVAVYAVCRFKGNQDLPQFDVMERWEVDRIRDMSQGYQRAVRDKNDTNPWIAHYEAMAVKTVLRRLSKQLPQSTSQDHLARAIALDELAEANLPQQFGELEPEAMEIIQPDRPPVEPAQQGRRMSLGNRNRGERIEPKNGSPVPPEEMSPSERAAAGIDSGDPVDDG